MYQYRPTGKSLSEKNDSVAFPEFPQQFVGNRALLLLVFSQGSLVFCLVLRTGFVASL